MDCLWRCHHGSARQHWQCLHPAFAPPAPLPLSAGTAIWRAVRPVPAAWPVAHGWCSWASPPGSGKAVVMAATLRDGQVAWQAFQPWPADRLAEIGGGRRAYVQEAGAQGAAGAAENGTQAPENGTQAGGGGSDWRAAGVERLQRAVAAVEGYPAVVMGEAQTVFLVVKARGAQCHSKLRGGEPAGRPCSAVCLLPSPASSSVACAAAGRPWGPADLIAGTDPSAIVEHGQFCREPEQCQVGSFSFAQAATALPICCATAGCT